MNLKNLFLVAVLGVILLTSSWFIGVPENKQANLASKVADFTLNSRPNILFNFPKGEPERVFIEPADSNVAIGNVSADVVLEKETNAKFASPTKSAVKKAPKKSLVRVGTYQFPDNPDTIDPVSYEGVLELLELLKGFGELISSPEGILSKEFRDLDAKIIAKTKEVYRNPHQTLASGEAFRLGEQCGLPGPVFSYPPGGNDLNTPCGGTPPIGGTGGAPGAGAPSGQTVTTMIPNEDPNLPSTTENVSVPIPGSGTCKTNPPCYFTGFCFQVCYEYKIGGYCYCWVPSCYGKCGNSTYIWDSITGTCGCGATGGTNIDQCSNNIPDDSNQGNATTITSDPNVPGSCLTSGTPTSPTTDQGGIQGSTATDSTLTDAQSQAFAQDSNITQTGVTPSGGIIVTDNVGGVDFSGVSNPNSPTVMFDNSMTQAEKDAWMTENANQVAKGSPDTVIYVAKDAAFNTIGSAFNYNVTNVAGFAEAQNINYPGETEPFSGIVIRSTMDNEVLAHELGHIAADQYLGNFGGNDPELNNLFKAQQELVNEGGIINSVTDYSTTNVGEYTAEVIAIYNTGQTNTAPTYQATVDYLKSVGVLK